jgi:superfamily I DNA/RNA helicase
MFRLDRFPANYEENERFHHNRILIKCGTAIINIKSRFPEIFRIAELLSDSADIHYRITGCFEYFDRLKIKNIREYLRLLEQNNPEALQIYEELRQKEEKGEKERILQFHSVNLEAKAS